MHLNEIPDINLEEYARKKLSIPAQPSPYIETIVGNDLANGNERKSEQRALPFARTRLLPLPIKAAKILCQGEDVKKVIELIFDLKDHEVDFVPGDTVGIMPVNKPEDVHFVLTTLDKLDEAEQALHISIMQETRKKAAKLPIYIPETSSCRSLLQHFLNIYSIPKKLFIRSLVDYTEDKSERLLMQILCSKEGGEIYNRFFVEKRFNFLDLLKMCPSCKPPIGVLIEHLPRLLPRPYSIANSSLKSPEDVKIVFSILCEESLKGLTTGQLEKKVENLLSDKDNPQTVNLYFRAGNAFRYTAEDLERNIIMIGVGCAVAPFLGFLEHKSELKNHLAKTGPIGTAWLFSGSRYRSNALYRNEICEYLKDGILDEYFESFSREADSEFKYVQDQIIANAGRFVELLRFKETKIYVCADGNEISKKISGCILECLKRVNKITDDEANDILKDMRQDSRYVEDIWL